MLKFKKYRVKISRRAVNLMTSMQNINIVYTLVGGFTARREIFTWTLERARTQMFIDVGNWRALGIPCYSTKDYKAKMFQPKMWYSEGDYLYVFVIYRGSIFTQRIYCV
jgi:glutaredoxin-related protein